jgi:DNA polymerase III gamma/tau subunit
VRLLGGLDTALFHTLLAGILGGDSAAVGAAVRRVEDEGWDPRHVYGQFLAFCRDALHLAMGGAPEAADLPGEEAQALATLARGHGYENLLRLMNQLLTSEMIVRRSETGALAVEIAWLRAAELPKLTRIEELLAGGTLPAEPPAHAAAPRPATPRAMPAPAATTAPAPQRSAPVPAPAPRPETPQTPQMPRAEAPRAEPSPRPAAPPPSRPSDPVAAFKEEAGKRKQNIGGFLDAAEDIRFADGRVTIVCPSGDNYLRTRLEANRAVLEESAAAVWGPGTRLDILVGTAAPQAAAEAKPAPVQQVEQIPTVQAVLDIFKGRIETVEEHGSYTEE